MAISVIMGFPLISTAPQSRLVGRFKENIRDKTVIPANPTISYLVETNSKIGVFYGNKFLSVAIMLQYSSRRAGTIS
jgi:hypothetical protein